jgi:hypothetical protein
MMIALNFREELPVLAMVISMILLLSNFYIYFRAPVSPPPNRYDFKSEFTLDKKKGFNFGGSR